MKRFLSTMTLALACLPMFLCRPVQAGAASGIVVMHFDLSRHDRDQEVKLWIPYPVSSAYQEIGSVRVSGDYAESALYADAVFQNPILYARWPGGSDSRHLTLSFTARRQEVRKDHLPRRERPWNKVDFSRWLGPTSLGPVDGQVAELAARITRGKKGVAAKARAIYDWTCENMYRDPKTIGCGKGDVCRLLKSPGGKCTDIHSVFVALCRAAGVPAREIFGIRLGKEPVEDITGWQHCWAEFYLPGFGWVPVDPADVRKLMLKKKLGPGDPETRRLREYFWGGWDAFRIRLALGRDIYLSPRQQGPPLNTFGYPYAEVNGKPLDFYAPSAFAYRFTAFRTDENGLARTDDRTVALLREQVPGLVIVEPLTADVKPELPPERNRLVVLNSGTEEAQTALAEAKRILASGYEKVLVNVHDLSKTEH